MAAKEFLQAAFGVARDKEALTSSKTVIIASSYKAGQVSDQKKGNILYLLFSS